MSDSQKWAAWLVVLAAVFLALAFLGKLALIGALALLLARIALVPSVLALTALAVRKTS